MCANISTSCVHGVHVFCPPPPYTQRPRKVSWDGLFLQTIVHEMLEMFISCIWPKSEAQNLWLWKSRVETKISWAENHGAYNFSWLPDLSYPADVYLKLRHYVQRIFTSDFSLHGFYFETFCNLTSNSIR